MLYTCIYCNKMYLVVHVRKSSMHTVQVIVMHYYMYSDWSHTIIICVIVNIFGRISHAIPTILQR